MSLRFLSSLLLATVLLQWVGNRPEMLKAIFGEIALDLGEARNLGQLLREGAAGLRDRLN